MSDEAWSALRWLFPGRYALSEARRDEQGRWWVTVRYRPSWTMRLLGDRETLTDHVSREGVRWYDHHGAPVESWALENVLYHRVEAAELGVGPHNMDGLLDLAQRVWGGE